MIGRRTVIGLASTLPVVLASVPRQQTPPIRDLGPIIATSADSIRAPIVVRGLANGNVFVNVGQRGRLALFDSLLMRVPFALDSTTFTGSSSLIPLRGDSTIVVDLASQTLLVLDNRGTGARAASVPKQTDLTFVANSAVFGLPAVDPRGRLIYRGAYKSVRGSSPYGSVVAGALSFVADSAPIVRADFDARTVDTIVTVRIDVSVRNKSVTPDATGTMIMKVEYNPFATSDAWVGLNDGTIAIVRSQDYHIDWISPDGQLRSTPRMPIERQRLTDEDKQRRLDSLRPSLDAMQRRALLNSGSAILTDEGARRLKYAYEFAPLTEIRDYETPFFGGLTRVDGDGNLWILPRTAANGGAGLLYDVVNQSGQITERVRLPVGRVLAGFGPRRVAYMTNATTARLEMARIR